MSHRIPKYIRLFDLLLIIFVVILISGCQLLGRRISQTSPIPSLNGKIVVLGFRSAVSKVEEAGVIRSPFSESVFISEPISQDITDKMTHKLFSRLKDYAGYEVIDRDKEETILSGPLSSGQGSRDKETFMRIGGILSAEAVMVGYIYRWRERRGSDYSADRPASTAFELCLIRSRDGEILWNGSFDKTQTALSENILEARIFFKGKGKWMTVEILADLGLSDILDSAFSPE
jgi:hypothetical protein